MNIILERFGKIARAEITLEGITVLVGPNGSGKSTVGRVLMTWFAVLRRLPKRLIEERIKSAREAVDAILKSHDLPEIGYSFSVAGQDSLKILRSETWRDVDVLAAHLSELPEYFFNERNAKADAERIAEFSAEVIGALDVIAARDGDYYLPSIFKDSFDTAFDKAFTTVSSTAQESSLRVVHTDDATSVLDFRDGRVTSWSVVPVDKVPLVYYFEPVHLLDLYAYGLKPRGQQLGLRLSAAGRYKAPDADWKGFLFGEEDQSEWSVERKRKHEELVAELDTLLGVMHGQLERKDRELRFADSEIATSIPVMNVASGIKTMGAIEKGIRSGAINPGCVLIIDEPESNLHPQWQIEFAMFLVKLNARFNIRLLLNTHSPFFLKAIEVFTREEGCAGKAHYYHMVRASDSSVCYSTRELKEGTNEVFKTYFDALNNLMSR